MIAHALLALALADIPVTELTWDYRPQHIALHRGELKLDGVTISGKRSDKRLYLETILPSCEAVDALETRRARRARTGTRLALGGVAIVLGASAMSPALAPAVVLVMVASGGGVAVGGGALALSGASMQRSIDAYNACAAPPNEGAAP